MSDGSTILSLLAAGLVLLLSRTPYAFAANEGWISHCSVDLFWLGQWWIVGIACLIWVMIKDRRAKK